MTASWASAINWPRREEQKALTTYRARESQNSLLFVGVIILTLVAGGVIGAIVVRMTSRSTHSVSKPATSRISQQSSSRQANSATSGIPGALRIISITPANGTTGVTGGTPITVTFSSGLATDTPLPSIAPTTAGSWRVNGTKLTFTPGTDFTPLSDVTLTVPTGKDGVTGKDGGRLTTSVTDQFKVANGSVARLQQLLALLDYSPLAWTPASAPIASTDTSGQLAALFQPPAGSYTWKNRGWPARLRAMWHPGVDNIFTRGLIMSFQADHGLTTNGHVTTSLWNALATAIGANTVNTGGYNYALANKAAPESLIIYHNGTVALRSPANTGISASPTPDGTFAVYTRLRQQIMRGTNPNGQQYADLVQYIAYFHGNDAVHYMDRADYGIPQSLGCVELPLADAARVWPYLAYGTLVTIIH